MIMGEKIALLRKQNGWSQEELAEKLDVTRQSVSRWESGGAIPDLDKVVRLSALFGVSTDYLVKDDLEEAEYAAEAAPPERGTKKRSVSVEEANAYMETVRRTGRGIALGVALFILSVAPLLCLMAVCAFAEPASVTLLSENAAEAIGTAAMFALIAAGVALCIVNGMRAGKYDYLKTEPLELAYGVYGIVEKKKEDFAPRYRLSITLGVAGIVLSLTPLLLANAMGAREAALIFLTAFMLACIAAAVYFIVTAATVNESFETLLEEGGFTPERKALRRRLGAMPGIYWGLTTALYLAVSFTTMRWDRTWIVWPVAGVLFPVVWNITAAIVRGNLSET